MLQKLVSQLICMETIDEVPKDYQLSETKLQSIEQRKWSDTSNLTRLKIQYIKSTCKGYDSLKHHY